MLDQPSSPLPPDIKAALVHYWLVNRRGGEAVLEAIGRLVPHAHLFAHVVDNSIPYGSLRGMPITKTFISRLPGAQRHYQAYLGLMPVALEALDMTGFDLIISSEAGPAKWVLPPPGVAHICYCHSPMRYLWDQRHTYIDNLAPVLRPFAHLAAHNMRQSDVLSSFRVTDFIANSSFVAQRINQFYRRDAEVVHPPIDVESFHAGIPEDFYLCAGEIRHYKRLDIAIEACRRLGRRLIIAGAGNASSLKKMAGPHVEFLGRLEGSELRSLMSRCRALLYPGVEDFGIVPVEVMASGRPVIAFGYGGVVDSVEPGISGFLYREQTPDALVDAITEFERNEGLYSAQLCQHSAARFSRRIFDQKFSKVIERALGAN